MTRQAMEAKREDAAAVGRAATGAGVARWAGEGEGRLHARAHAGHDG